MNQAASYEEAIKMGKALKRNAPRSCIEIEFDGISAEFPERRY